MASKPLRRFAAGRGVQLQQAHAAGAGASTNITITGIRKGDDLVSVFELQPPTAGAGNAIVANRTAATTITANDTIQISVATTGNQVLVTWLRKAR